MVNDSIPEKDILKIRTNDDKGYFHAMQHAGILLDGKIINRYNRKQEEEIARFIEKLKQERINLEMCEKYGD